MFFKRRSIKIEGHGPRVADHLFIAESGIDPINQVTGTCPDAGKHASDKIGVVSVVICGIGEDIDEHIRHFQALPGHIPVCVAAFGASIDIGCIQKDDFFRQHWIGAEHGISGC